MMATPTPRTKYRFLHRSDDGLTYYWQSVSSTTGDSRHEIVRCPVEWFWNPIRIEACS